MLGYLYEKRFASKIAWANQKEGDKVGAGLSRETGCGGQQPTWIPRVRMWRGYGTFGWAFSRINTPTFWTRHSSYLPTYEDGTDIVFRTIGI